MRTRRPQRRGLTLLEMVLTFAIGMAILLTVFMVMRSQYLHTQAGRESIEEATLARNILTKVSSDIVNSLGPVDPRFLPPSILPNNANQGLPKIANMSMGAGSPASSNSSSSSPTTTAQTTTTANGKTTSTTTTQSSTNNTSSSNNGTSSTTASSSTSSGSSSSSGTAMTPVPYNLGIKGDAKWLIISSSRLPGALLGGPQAAADSTVVSSDLRSLAIWLVDGEGLARSEMTAVTSDDAPLDESGFPGGKAKVFAPQVQDILFEYFDGVSWQASWDGGQLGGNDGNTPIGPPAAIAITLTLRSSNVDEPDARPRKYKHVVALPASNAFTQANQGGASQQMSGTTLLGALQSGQMQPMANQQNQSGSQSSSSSSSTGQ
jgi:hypothetical protein